MHKHTKIVTLFFLAMLPPLSLAGGVKKKDRAAKPEEEITRGVLTLLWRQPKDFASRDLFYGPGGKKDEPHGPFTFVKEDLDGSNPKFTVRDPEGAKWKVKLGAEAEPETVASRLVWSVGYFANEDYFLPELRVKNMPAHLQRKYAGKFIEPDGSMRNVRLKRAGR
jgi:hypothetical protein